MEKHAYLIMAHNQFELLKILLSCLDHERNDIFIHIDKKATCNFDDIQGVLKKSRCFFTPRICVNWGGYSQIQSELILLKAATDQGHYAYYHLITGVDMPLRPQREILEWFDRCGNKEFISCSEQVDAVTMERVRYFYPFQEWFHRNSFLGKLLRKASLVGQKVLNTDRTRSKRIKWGVGSAYFDITDKMARYLLSQEDFIRKHFRFSLCADEMFLQTVFLNSPYAQDDVRYISDAADHPYIQHTYFDVMRAIDWTRGKPYVYTAEDFDMLMNSKCLFARKFDWQKDSSIVRKIATHFSFSV